MKNTTKLIMAATLAFITESGNHVPAVANPDRADAQDTYKAYAERAERERIQERERGWEQDRQLAREWTEKLTEDRIRNPSQLARRAANEAAARVFREQQEREARVRERNSYSDREKKTGNIGNTPVNRSTRDYGGLGDPYLYLYHMAPMQ